jgi:hypothetical protein
VPLANAPPLHRVKEGDYRVIYCIHDHSPAVVNVLAIVHRSSSYRRLDVLSRRAWTFFEELESEMRR